MRESEEWERGDVGFSAIGVNYLSGGHSAVHSALCSSVSERCTASKMNQGGEREDPEMDDWLARRMGKSTAGLMATCTQQRETH